MKSELQANTLLMGELRDLLRKQEYPEQGRPFVYIGFESQETVDRESGGNWYHHLK